MAPHLLGRWIEWHWDGLGQRRQEQVRWKPEQNWPIEPAWAKKAVGTAARAGPLEDVASVVVADSRSVAHSRRSLNRQCSYRIHFPVPRHRSHRHRPMDTPHRIHKRWNLVAWEAAQAATEVMVAMAPATLSFSPRRLPRSHTPLCVS